MPLVALKPTTGLSLGNSALICSDTGLPRVAASIWCSLNQLRYSDKYLRSYLRAFERFYVHCSHVQTEHPVDLDYLLASGKIDEVISKFTTFIAELQNKSIRTGVDQSETCRMVCSILGDVLNEFAQRRPDYNVSNSELARKLANLETLYKYLKPSRSGKSFTKRSLPPDVIEEMFSLFDPVSNESIFRSESISCLLYTSPSPRDGLLSRMPSSA